MDVTVAPSIVTVAMIHGGVRNNIIPDSVVMEGTIRTLDKGQQTDIHQRIPGFYFFLGVTPATGPGER